jgi:hypothetical protein
MRFCLWFFSCFLASLFFLSCGKKDEPEPDPKTSESSMRTARILFLEGTVWVKHPKTSDWIPAQLNQELLINDKIRTMRDSFATVEFEEGGILKLGPESLVKVTDLRIEPRNNARRSTFTLMEGKVEAEVNPIKIQGAELKIKTKSVETHVIRREVAFQ